MSQRAWPLWLFLWATVSLVYAQDDAQGNKKGAKTDKPARAAGKDGDKPLNKEQEQAVLSFAREHHAELADLLIQLKESNPAEYRHAIEELAPARQRLLQTKERDPRRYELDLKAWQIKSRIQLLAARLRMARNQGLETELRAALLEQIDLRLQQQKLERERVATRLESLNAAIEKTEQTRQQEADKAFERLTRAGTKPKPKVGPDRKQTTPNPETASDPKP